MTNKHCLPNRLSIHLMDQSINHINFQQQDSNRYHTQSIQRCYIKCNLAESHCNFGNSCQSQDKIHYYMINIQQVNFISKFHIPEQHKLSNDGFHCLNNIHFGIVCMCLYYYNTCIPSIVTHIIDIMNLNLNNMNFNTTDNELNLNNKDILLLQIHIQSRYFQCLNKIHFHITNKQKKNCKVDILVLLNICHKYYPLFYSNRQDIMYKQMNHCKNNNHLCYFDINNKDYL